MDKRIRRIKKRKKKQQPVDPTLIALSLMGSAVGCLVLGLLISWLRWLILVSAAINILAGIALIIYVLYAYDEDPLGDIDINPRSCFCVLVALLGFAQLIIYVSLSFRAD